MDVLIRFGFTIDEIQSMMNTNDSIDTVSDKDIYELIDILKNAGCNDSHIKNIFLCNPFYLTRDVLKVHRFIQKLYEIGCSSLYLLFDSNPYILNINDVDLDRLYNKKMQEGFSREEIIDFINYDRII